MLTQNKHGFTIVELLIVIVVISILAAITVVAFNGIQERAKVQQAASVANAYIKLLKLYKADKGTYPVSTSDAYPTWGDACLGLPSDFPAEGVYAAGDCVHSTSSTYRVGGSTSVMNALSQYGKLPTSSSKIASAPYGPERWRGLRYTYTSSWDSPVLEWIVNGDHPEACPPIASTANYSTYTICDVRDW